MKKWSICLPSYNNYTEIYFTIQALRLYHDLTDVEIVVVDNFGDDVLAKFCKEKGAGLIKYDRFTEITGVSAAKNRAISLAEGEFVLCMDSHILLKPGALEITPPADDFVQGPCLYNNFKQYGITWEPRWRRGMWGVWAPAVETLPAEPVEIWGTGAGLFATRRASWLGFNPGFRAFGGETGYIQEKYRQAGRRVWSDPRLIWVHYFANIGREPQFPHPMVDRVRNYILGFSELGLDLEPIKKHYGAELFEEAGGFI
jgi:glycosyltransferase involved in cell wall biosynthesis